MKNLSPSSNTSMVRHLESLRVRQPCPKDWNEMKGTAQKRFCEHCSLHVHNLSAMSPRQVKNLADAPGRRCVAYFEKENGHIQLRSRFVSVSRSFSRTRRLAASLLALVFPFSFISCSPKNPLQASISSPTTQQTPDPMRVGKISLASAIPPKPVPIPEKMLMGDVAVPPPQTVSPAPAPATVPHSPLKKKALTVGF